MRGLTYHSPAVSLSTGYKCGGVLDGAEFSPIKTNKICSLQQDVIEVANIVSSFIEVRSFVDNGIFVK
ncbi:MAG: hypothetical protein HC836_16955 [Richelia sp. RM2_1_2]|nr:hypothetical protein [Richelia sp. SM1_7_0]NJO31324.1 hypothetical protein [Richelia sp. SL_2_1]NJO59900.1 hypothetical protein [Richelia sp. RM2_1_2]